MNASDPFFTWTCLFPDDASYRFSPRSTWAREVVATGSSRSTVYLTAEEPVTEMPDLDAFAGLAALNCHGLSDRMLHEAGFSYVRRFAVLPGARNPRWFIPLDTPAISAAGFCLCAPFKAAARIQHHGARAAARLGLPFWYRDQLCIAQRAVPPIEEAIRNALPGTPLNRLAISSGTPPPAINRKISLAVLAPGGQVVGFAKLPGPCAASERSVRHEVAVLSQMGRRRDARAPHVLFADTVGTRYLALFTPLPGRAPGLEPTHRHHRFLHGLASGEVKVAGETKFVRSLSERRALLRGRPALMATLNNLLPLLGTLRLPATTIHGDFVPWNLREHAGAIGAFDWEYAEIDGIPLVDEMHHLLAVGYLLKNWTPEQAHARLLDVAAAAPRGIAPDAARALQLAYLLDYLLRLFGEGHSDDYPRIAWCREIVARLAPAAVKGVAA